MRSAILGVLIGVSGLVAAQCHQPGDGDADADGDGDADPDGDSGVEFNGAPCEPHVPDEPTAADLARAEVFECHTNADCTDGIAGRCVFDEYEDYLGGDPTMHCTYDACLVDEDCDAGHLCACEVENAFWTSYRGHGCIPGNCATDQDCGAGHLCLDDRSSCMLVVSGRFCTTATDECDPREDECPDNEDMDPITDGACRFDGDAARWVCGYESCYD